MFIQINFNLLSFALLLLIIKKDIKKLVQINLNKNKTLYKPILRLEFIKY